MVASRALPPPPPAIVTVASTPCRILASGVVRRVHFNSLSPVVANISGHQLCTGGSLAALVPSISSSSATTSRAPSRSGRSTTLPTHAVDATSDRLSVDGVVAVGAVIVNEGALQCDGEGTRPLLVPHPSLTTRSQEAPPLAQSLASKGTSYGSLQYN